MKKKTIILSILIIFTGVYMYIRFIYLKAPDFKPDNSKAHTVLDLRPSIIAKLQQMVKDGSNGLYFLSIDKLDPDVVGSKLDISNASIHIDTAGLNKLRQLKNCLTTFSGYT